MGNIGSIGGGGGGNSRPRNSHLQSPPPSRPTDPEPEPSEVAANRYVVTAAYPELPQYPNPYYPPPPPSIPITLPSLFDHHHLGWVGGVRYPCPLPPQVRASSVEHQKAITIRNDINVKKETLRVEPDEQNPGRFLVAFMFDATIAGSITVYFFAKEGFDCKLTSTKENLLGPVTTSFQEGLGQKFRQPSGTGIDFSMFEEAELIKEGEMEVYPLAVKAEASPSNNQGLVGENQKMETPNSQITQAVFERKENGEYQVRMVKQILCINGTKYELQEIYGIGNSVDNDFDGNDTGKECVICLSEPQDTTVLPCRHMCMCSECAKVLRFQTNRCPICRQPVERLLEIKVNNRAEEQLHESR